MALRRSDVEASIKVAEAQLSAAEAKYKEKAKGKLKKHPVWRAANSNLKKVKKRLVAIENLATRETALKEKKAAKA